MCIHIDPGGMTLPEWSGLPDIGLYMDQVIVLMERTFASGEITKSMVNNYVKAGLIKRPSGKKYDRDQLAQLIVIGVLKQALRLEDIAKILSVLSEEGMQAGYARFCSAVQAVSGAIQTGDMDCFGSGQTPECRAVMTGITAAVCAIHTRRLLGTEKEKR